MKCCICSKDNIKQGELICQDCLKECSGVHFMSVVMWEEEDHKVLDQSLYAMKLTEISPQGVFGGTWSGYLINVSDALRSGDTFGEDLGIILRVAEKGKAYWLIALPE